MTHVPSAALALAPAASRPDARPFARVDAYDDLGAAREAWRALDGAGGVYQSFDFVAAYAAAFDVRPVVAVARGADGAVAALLPLAVRRFGPLRVASLVGGSWANYHMGLFSPCGAWSGEDVAALLRAAGKRLGVDMFAFSSLPATWDGRTPPLSLLPGPPCPSPAFATALTSDPVQWLDARMSRASQKKLRKKVRKLESLGAVRHARAADGAEARRFLDAFLGHKSSQARVRNVADLFAAPHVRELLVKLIECGAMEMHAVLAGERIAATFGALPGGRRLSGLVISYDGAPEIACASPGEWLVVEVARDAAARGFCSLDLGVGDARYKRELCEIEERLHDAVFAVTPVGRLAGAAWLAGRAAKGWIKRHPRLFRLAQRFAGTPG